MAYLAYYLQIGILHWLGAPSTINISCWLQPTGITAVLRRIAIRARMLCSIRNSLSLAGR